MDWVYSHFVDTLVDALFSVRTLVNIVENNCRLLLQLVAILPIKHRLLLFQMDVLESQCWIPSMMSLRFGHDKKPLSFLKYIPFPPYFSAFHTPLRTRGGSRFLLCCANDQTKRFKREKEQDPLPPRIRPDGRSYIHPFKEHNYVGQIVAEMLSVVCHKPFVEHVQEVTTLRSLLSTLPAACASAYILVLIRFVYTLVSITAASLSGTNVCVDLPYPRVSFTITSVPLHLPTFLPKRNISSGLAYEFTCFGKDKGL